MARFRKNGSRIVEVDLAGESVKSLAGAMIAYEGEISFKKAGFGGGEGIRGAIKRKATGESLDLMECTGTGTVYFAHDATEIELVPLASETLQVESSSLLALDSGLKTNVTFTGLRGASADRACSPRPCQATVSSPCCRTAPRSPSRSRPSTRWWSTRMRTWPRRGNSPSPSSPTCPGGQRSGRVRERRSRYGSTGPAWC